MDTNTDKVRAHDELRVQAALLRTPEFLAQFDPDKFAGQLERIAAALAQQPAAPSGEPAVWVAADTLNSPHPTCVSSLAYMSQADKDRGREYVPLYTAPQQPAAVDEERMKRDIAAQAAEIEALGAEVGALTARLGDIYQIADAALAREDRNG